MKFFHVYNEQCFEGLVKNGLINRDTGFKIQHCFAVPKERQFNQYAAKETRLYNLIKDGNYPFYVDRIAGGITYFPYSFDRALIDEYRAILGDWFLGFQMHESGSNRREGEWQWIIRDMGGKGPYDAALMRKKMMSNHAVTRDGIYLPDLVHDTPEYYAGCVYAETYREFVDEMREMFARRIADTNHNVLPCDSYYLLPKLQDEMGMRTFMPEVGSQICMMRIAVALARGVAKASAKTWGTYYECWRIDPDGVCMPCFNLDPVNEWYLTQETHTDDFTTHGERGGSSRLLQNRIYYHALMSGADYFSEEWGLNCSYTDMNDFTLSAYGEAKKSFINAAEGLRGIQAVTPFAIVLPKSYICVEIPNPMQTYELGVHRDQYMYSPLSAHEKGYFGHIEDVLKLFFSRNKERFGNEGHVLTNSRFGDVFDIIYEDADEQTLCRYDYLIDATQDSAFAAAKSGRGLKILESQNLELLEHQVHKLTENAMPCVVDGLHWLVSKDEKGQRYLTIFNNEGNERSSAYGDVLDHRADQRVKVSFKEPAKLRMLHCSGQDVRIESADPHTSYVTVPAAGFAVMAF